MSICQTCGREHGCDDSGHTIHECEQIIAKLRADLSLASEIISKKQEIILERFIESEMKYKADLEEANAQLSRIKSSHVVALDNDAQRIQGLVKDLDEAERLLSLLRPHIPPTAIDGEKAKTHPVSECYLNTMADTFLAKRKANAV